MIEETKRNLYSGQSESVNRLDGAISASATSILFKYDLVNIQRGSVLCVDLEEMQVWDTSGKTATVSRSINGSSPATHLDLATVFVQPRFSNFRIFQAINHDLDDLSSPINGMYRVLTSSLTYNPAIEGYDLTGSLANPVLGIVDIDYATPGPAKTMPSISTFSLKRLSNTTDFPSGNALVLYAGGFPGLEVRVRYRTSFGQFVNLGDTHTTVGLPATAVDLPPLGASMRLVAPRDVKRSFSETQGEPRRAEEVPVGSANSAMRGIMMLRQSRILAEAARLESMYPKVMP